jgi:DNA (cytosine-5)-methyltransferase 1
MKEEQNVLLPKRSMRELHLFAGAGGGILGGMLLGHTTICAVELEPYCREVLLQRQRDGILPKFPIWDDVCTFDGKPWRGKVDVVCGGFPCQDISSAGKGAGITGERSGLWGEMARIIGEIRPKYIFVENSPMLTLRGLDRVLGDLSEMGYDARWGVVGAFHVGAPHRRERIWILAHPVSERYNNRFNIRKEKRNSSHGNRNKNSPWTSDSIKPCSSSLVDRNVDGVAHRVDRLKAIGNGQVPLVAATAWRILGGE